MNRVPYVYWVKNKTTGQKYVGVRYAKNCNPSDLWATYFTSSNAVKKLINLYGPDDFIVKVLHTYESAKDAIIREAAYVKLAINKPDYLNFCRLVTTPTSCSKAGKIGGVVQKEKRLGIHKQTKNERLEILKRARKIQLKMGQNAFINATKKEQSKRGKCGGVKNKGFVWLTNGTNTIKYTTTQQEKVTVEEFLKANPTYRRGRSL